MSTPTKSTLSTGADLRALRERKPLVHQITNYVVMNETANATLALGALPVMAHAREEVEEMVALADALVLNIGTLSPHWVDAMLAAGKGANARGTPVVLDPVGAGATSYRTETARRILDEVDVTVLRGNAGEIATLVGVEAEVRGVESIGAGGEPAELAREAARALGVVASVTGPVDHVSDGQAALAVANGHELLAAVSGTGCMSSAVTGCFLAAKPEDPLAAAAEALAAFGVAGEDAAVGAKGPGSFHVNLYDALAALDPQTLDGRTSISGNHDGLDVASPRDQGA
jgi:hydroxyethylthiazole kinase